MSEKLALILSCSSLLLSFVVLLFSFIQWKKQLKFNYSETVKKLITELRNDKELRTFIYYIDYDINWYTDDFHNNNTENEQMIDKALSFYSFICYLLENNLLTPSDFKVFEYEVKRVIENKDTKNIYNI